MVQSESEAVTLWLYEHHWTASPQQTYT